MKTAVPTDTLVTALWQLSRKFMTKKLTVQTRILLKAKGVHLLIIPGKQSELELSQENWDQLCQCTHRENSTKLQRCVFKQLIHKKKKKINCCRRQTGAYNVWLLTTDNMVQNLKPGCMENHLVCFSAFCYVVFNSYSQGLLQTY